MKLTTKRLAPAVAVVALLVLPLLASTTASAETLTFSNATALNIPPPGQFGPPWKANLYPSPIAVSGMSGTVTDVNVTLSNLNCSANGGVGVYPDDMDVLLVGPGGQDTMLISDVGGDYNNGQNVNGVTLVLDDAAATVVPEDSPASVPPSTPLVSGTYKPTDDDNDPDELPTDTFSNHRTETPLAARFDGPVPSGNSLLSTYNGTNPNGTWNLYYVDDVAGFENCEITGGWSMTITTTGPTTTTTAPTTTTTAPTTTTTAPTTTTTAPTTTTTAPTTTTAAPTTTTAAPTTTTAAPTTTTAAPTTTTAAPTTTTAAPTTTTAAPTTTTAAPTTTTAAPTTTTTAPTTTTTAPTTTTTAPTTTTTAPTTTTTAPTTTTTAPTTTTTTAPPSADLRVTKTASATDVRAGRRLTYTVKAVNLGPSTASNVVLTEDLPDDFTITSRIPTNCTVSATGNVITCTYASVAQNNRGVSLKITGNYASAGLKTNTASVTSDTPDPNPDNNSTSLNVNVT